MTALKLEFRCDQKPGGAIRYCLAAVLTLLLTSCSRIQLAYNNLDWLLPRYLASYMPLSEAQDKRLKTGVNYFLHWHCSTQISHYSHLLREASSRIQDNSLTRSGLETFSNRIEQSWTDMLQQAGPSIAGILMTADDDQVQALFEGFDKRNAKWLKEFEDESPEDQHRGYQKRMTRELRRWFGKLDQQQRQTLTDWSKQFQPLGMEGLKMRQRWQSRLQTLMSRRGNREEFQREFAKLLSSPEPLRTLPYRQRIHNNHVATIDMLYTIIHGLSKKQKQHLQHKVNAITGDFDSLACSDETVASY